MPMESIPNWRGEPIEVARSKGGVLAVVNPTDNLVTTGVSPWPPPEIAQKLYQSRQTSAFAGSSHEAVVSVLGFHSDLQSLHSEDAITWSVFGTVAYANPAARRAFADALLSLLRIPASPARAANVWLWRRVPHPDTLGSGGPEIDFGVQTQDVILLGEAKWRSGIGRAQGKARDKDQLTLRREFLKKNGQVMFGSVSRYILLTLSRHGGILEDMDVELDRAVLHLRDTTWESVCSIESHPASAEIRRYLIWKEKNTKTT
jgi:hypothetical protein